jgi:cell wall-associated NlpC family hydrolase
MALDGIAAVQARIQAIEQQVSAAAAPATAATSGSGASTGADFASLLSNAMSSQAVSGSTGTDATGSTTGSGTDISSLISSLTGGSSASAGGTNLSSLISSLTGTSGSTGALGALGTASPTIGAPTIAAPNPTTLQFVNTALGQQGKPYVWGASASPTNASPTAFDCSELTKWAAARSGVTIPDGAAHQYVWLKQQGATMSVQQALQTPGALLFHFASEPQPGLGGEPPVAHVAISLGNGMTIEARGHAYGVGVFEAGDRFNYAGMIPGMT